VGEPAVVALKSIDLTLLICWVQCYIDRLITTFMKVLHKMAREHLTPTTSETSPGMVPCHNDCITYYFILHV
jgi:hypothetical protein